MIRPGTAEDAEAVARVVVASWQAAYAHALPHDQLASLSVEERADEWRRRPPLVADVDGEVVGFCSVGAARDEDADGELFAIYVLPNHWGTGVGRRPSKRARTNCVGSGIERPFSGWMDDNPRARRFYEIAGWSVDGQAREIEMFGFQIAEVRYAKNL